MFLLLVTLNTSNPLNILGFYHGGSIQCYPKQIIALLKLVLTSLVNFRSWIVKMKSFLMLILLVAVIFEVFGAKPVQRGGRNEKGKISIFEWNLFVYFYEQIPQAWPIITLFFHLPVGVRGVRLTQIFEYFKDLNIWSSSKYWLSYWHNLWY